MGLAYKAAIGYAWGMLLAEVTSGNLSAAYMAMVGALLVGPVIFIALAEWIEAKILKRRSEL